MDDTGMRITGASRCGALRCEAGGAPLRFSGRTRQFVTKSARGGDAARYACAVRSSLVFGEPAGCPA